MTKVFAALFALLTATSTPTVNWPLFRGPGSSGVAEGFATPITWSVRTLRNVNWRTPIPGMGHSSPIVWGDHIFVTAAVGQGKEAELRVGLYGDIAPANDQEIKEFRVYCLDKNDGAVIWYRTAHRGIPRVKRHTKSSHANPTLATDGQNLVAFFGSEGLYCYDMGGNLRWTKDLGLLDSGFFRAPAAQWGFASSPVIHDGKIFVQCDVISQAFVAAFDISDGKELWRTVREDVPSWSTPAVYVEDGQKRLVVNGFKCIAGYDLETGKEIWRLEGGGESSNRYVAWSYSQGGAYMQTPLVYGNYLYLCRDNGVLSCFVAKTGERIYQQRLGRGGSGFSASLVAADGKIYATSEDGDIYVVSAGSEFRVLATNSMNEICMATPALSEGMLIFRTRNHVTAIGRKGSTIPIKSTGPGGPPSGCPI
jgi:outer membrane protein assembly factor BamB